MYKQANGEDLEATEEGPGEKAGLLEVREEVPDSRDGRLMEKVEGPEAEWVPMAEWGVRQMAPRSNIEETSW